MKRFVLVLAIMLCGSNVWAANAPQLIGEYGDWLAYFYKDGKGMVCYMASAPKKDEGKYDKRGDIYTVVTHRPQEKSFDVVNFVAGYTFKKDSDVVVKIGNKEFRQLFIDEDKAWAMNDKVDKELVAAMKNGDKMYVHGVSGKGNPTKDTYSLKGFGGAYKAITAKCKK